MTRDELVKRLEAAIVGSRELDAHIAAQAWPNAHAAYLNDDDRPLELDPGEWVVLRRTSESLVTKHRPPLYSTSVDAALLLVPKGQGWELTFRRREHLHAAGLGDIRNPANGRYENSLGLAKTAALALCAAALRAGA